ncbi:MAG: mechanosensitive ion channel [Oscillospiraceae bacterium]|nr:mechanosensitive ion channel [Oscillospiraceae bacterium]
MLFLEDTIIDLPRPEEIDATYLEKLWQRFLDYIPTLITAAVIFVVGMILDRIVMHIISRGLKSGRLDKTIHGFLRSVIHIIMIVLTLIITLSTLGIPMTSIIAVISAAGLAIGLALQNSLSNVAGGFIILLSKPFKVGDYIQINGTEGTVRMISIINTELKTLDNKSVFMPNGSISSSTVINYTAEPYRRVDLLFPISYSEDFTKAAGVIKDVISKSPRALTVPPPTVRVKELAGSSVNICAWVWVNTGDYWDAYFDITEAVKTAFDENGIEIPFEQLDVHIDRLHRHTDET